MAIPSTSPFFMLNALIFFVVVYGMIWVIFLVLGWFEEISIFFHSTEECFGSIPPSLPSREFGDMITEYAFCNLPFV